MTSKRKYKNKQKVECMSCGEVLLKENEGMHMKRKHIGENVKFKFYNDAKQLRLPFQVNGNLSKDINSNLPQDAVNTVNKDEAEPSQSVECTSNLDDGLADQNIITSGLGNLFDSNPQDNIDHRVDNFIVVQSSLELSEGSGEINEQPQEEFEQVEVDSVSNLRCVSEDLPFQPKLDKFNPKKYGDKMRDFQISWYGKHPWINFNTSMSSVTCFPCQKFLKDGHFSFDNLKKPERLTTHSKSEAHLLAMTKWMDSKATASNNNNILTQLQKKHDSEVQDNRKYLQMLIESVAHLAKQNIAFRGHNEDRSKLTELSDQNRGNFLETLSLMSKYSPFLKVRLEKQLKNKSYMDSGLLIKFRTN